MDTAWKTSISKQRLRLQNPYAFCDEIDEYESLRTLRLRGENPYAYVEEIAQFQQLRVNHSKNLAPQKPINNIQFRTDAEIEGLARELQISLWAQRKEIFLTEEEINPIDLLDPAIAFRVLGYRFEIADALGQLYEADRPIRVAGLLDKTKRMAMVSGSYPGQIRNFTAAHELGHALMHEVAGVHRDKPLDGSASSRDRMEQQADKFAAYFLMPGKLLKVEFESRFGKSPFELDDASLFALAGAISNSKSHMPKSARELSRLLGGAPRFNGRNIVPLSTRFNVSAEAMAIRIEELGLISMDARIEE